MLSLVFQQVLIIEIHGTEWWNEDIDAKEKIKFRINYENLPMYSISNLG
jgi:hypothetical protein